MELFNGLLSARQTIAMKIFVNHIGHILMQRLENKGVDKTKLPGVLRELSNFDLVDPRVSLAYINERMHYLGWGDFKLDYHTLQLAIACFETGEMEGAQAGIKI